MALKVDVPHDPDAYAAGRDDGAAAAAAMLAGAPGEAGRGWRRHLGRPGVVGALAAHFRNGGGAGAGRRRIPAGLAAASAAGR